MRLWVTETWWGTRSAFVQPKFCCTVFCPHVAPKKHPQNLTARPCPSLPQSKKHIESLTTLVPSYWTRAMLGVCSGMAPTATPGPSDALST